MTLDHYISTHRQTTRKPTADIRSRWVSRIVARNLHQQGRAGAATYLRDYGRGISTSKVVALALQAECEGCDDLAKGFWTKAYHLDTGREVDPASLKGSASPSQQPQPTSSPGFPDLPSHLQPGSIVTMQPVDAERQREDYIADPLYLGQPKRDGSRMLVIATASNVAYPGRSTAIQACPGVSFDGAFRRAAEARGPFVLDGELVFLDASGGEHRTGSQAAHGHPDARVRCRICVFKALFANGRDLTGSDEEARINAAGPILAIAQATLIKAGVEDYELEQVSTAQTSTQKRALVRRQQAEGREGEVWVRRDTTYLGGKVGEAMVRTKYLTETEVVITGLTPTTVKGRPFGALEVAVRQADGSLLPAGRVGTGFDATDAAEIAALCARHPSEVRILVRHQGRTETGMLWHARFLKLIQTS